MAVILFPTDLSDAANHAFIYALHFARRLEARIVTLHVFQRPDIRGGTHIPLTLENFYQSFDLYAFENYRDNIPPLDRIAQEHGFTDLDIRHSLIEGRTVPTIINQAKAEGADYIIMGTTGARGLKEIFLGSVAGELMENAPCPVLAVPEKTAFDDNLDRIALTTSYHEDEIDALDRVLALADRFEARVDVVNVDLAHTEAYTHRMDTLRKAFADRANVRFHVLEGDDFNESMTHFLEQQATDLLAMVTHRRTFLQELFHYSRAKQLSYHCETPVLAFPAEALKAGWGDGGMGGREDE